MRGREATRVVGAESVPTTRYVEPWRPNPTPSVGGLVIGGDYQGLGIVRSLGQIGAPVWVIDDELSIARASRYATRAVRVRSLRDEASTVTALLAAGRAGDLAGWVLYPTREETVAAIARNRPTLEGVFRVPTPDWDVVRYAWDKRNTYRLADELAIPIPRTWFLDGLDDVCRIEGPGPWAVKPAIKEHFLYRTGAKAWRADDRRSLAATCRRAAKVIDPREIIVQELIPGDGRRQYAFCAFCRDGTVVAAMTVRRLRQHPYEFGRASTLVETVRAPEIETLASRFLARVGYYGLVEVEFKADPRDGRCKLLDVNARTWGYHTLGASAGVDFPAILFRDQMGDWVEPIRARPGIRWVRLATDLPAAAVEVWQGRLSVSEYVRSLSGVATDAVFSWRDPLPGLMEMALVPYLAMKRGF